MTYRVQFDLAQFQAGRKRVTALLRAGEVNFTPDVQRAGRALKAETRREIETQGDGTWPPRRPNTEAFGAALALGGPRGSVASGTRVAALQTRQRPREYRLDIVASLIGLFMDKGTRPHTIRAKNPTGRLAFPVLAGGKKVITRPQSVQHPGTPPRPFTKPSSAWWQRNLIEPMRARLRAAAAGRAS